MVETAELHRNRTQVNLVVNGTYSLRRVLEGGRVPRRIRRADPIPPQPESGSVRGARATRPDGGSAQRLFVGTAVAIR
jgi:hypothetical protein